MSKQWNPGRQTVALRPSRIRRDPVRLTDPAQKAPPISPEREMWGGIAGVLLFAAAIATVTVGTAVAMGYWKTADPAAARAGKFGHCYEGAPNCVADGDTIAVGGANVEIAGMEAPEIQDARCTAERDRGVEAAVRLLDLLNSGRVTVGPTFRDQYGRDVRKVQVKGRDVGSAMIEAGLARRYDGKRKSWC